MVICTFCLLEGMSSFPFKLLVFSGLVIIAAYFTARHHVTIFLALKDYCPWIMSFHKSSGASKHNANEPAVRIIQPAELSAHSSSSEKILLSILGLVFDVTKGQKHYGVDGGYNFFSGKDATRAFVTGDFTEEGLIDDISDFDSRQCSELKQWTEFYHEHYTYLGRLVGRFYDANGHPTEALNAFTKCAAVGDEEKQAADLDRIKYPPCNSRWSKAEGGYISCAPGSGGVEREWGGVPRQYFRPSLNGQTGDPRCACIRTSGLSGEGTDTGDRGDLDNPLFKVYEGDYASSSGESESSSPGSTCNEEPRKEVDHCQASSAFGLISQDTDTNDSLSSSSSSSKSTKSVDEDEAKSDTCPEKRDSLPNFLEKTDKAKVATSIYSNQYKEREMASTSILEQHVRLTDPKTSDSNKRQFRGKRKQFNRRDGKPPQSFSKLRPEDSDDESATKFPRKQKVGISDALVPPKKALRQLDMLRANERPWTKGLMK